MNTNSTGKFNRNIFVITSSLCLLLFLQKLLRFLDSMKTIHSGNSISVIYGYNSLREYFNWFLNVLILFRNNP
jgi:hypothetical protein